MSDGPLVSVIIIFLNAERFIEEAIKSVLAQAYGNWELLLVDDGSTDASTEVARRYAAEKPGQVHYLEHDGHQNLGKGASRNLGIRNATGQYVGFLDADDVWLPYKLEQQVQLLEAHPEAAMLYGNTLYWYSWTATPGDERRDFMPELGVRPDKLIPPPTLLPLFLKGKAAVPCTCSILVNRMLIQDIGGFDEFFRGIFNVYEDQAFYAKVCLRAPVLVSEACWDRYRQHPGASVAVARRSGQEQDARQFFLKWLADYLIEQGIEDPEVWQALRQEVWLGQYPTWLPAFGRGRFLVRWAKKWLLRLEELVFPTSVIRRLWVRTYGL